MPMMVPSPLLTLASVLAAVLAVQLPTATVALAAPPTHAPSVAEQQAFSEGLRLYEAGDASGAERAWKAGYDLGHDPAFLVRIGEAQEKRGASAEAVDSYQRYLRESPDAADRADIEARISRLAPSGPGKPAPEVETPGEMGGAPPPGPAGLSNPGPPGPGPGGAPATGAGQRRDDEAAALEASIAGEDERTAIGTAAWVGTGVTALLLGTAIYFAASAQGNAGDANRLLTYADPDTLVPLEYARVAAQYEEDVRLGKRNDRLAKGFALAAAATALVSTVLFVIDPGVEKKPPPQRTRPSAALPPALDRGWPARRARTAALPTPTLVPAVARVLGPRGAGLGLAWRF